MGRPSKYNPEFCLQAEKLCHLGATDKELADFFGVSESTLNNWKTAHPEFLESLNRAKAEADAKVVRSLFQRATGYSHHEDKIFNDNGKPLVVPTQKHYAPDTTAAIFWLKNRDPKHWRDVQTQVVHQGRAEGLSDDDLENIATGGGKGTSGKEKGTEVVH